MSRLSQDQQIIYNKKALALLNEYKILRKYPTKINSNDLITKYDIKRNNKLITYKQLSKILQKHNILSQKKWRAKYIKKLYLLLQNKNCDRENIIKIIADKLQIKKSSVNGILRNQGFSTKKYPENDILNDYKNGLTPNIIFDKYKINYAIFSKIAQDNNINIDTFWYVKNSNYKYRNLFEINTLNAHLIGLIWADGSISSARQVVINLYIDDKEYLEKVQKYLFINDNKTSLAISDHSKTTSRKSQKNSISLLITRVDYVKYLKELGMTLNKEKQEILLPKFIKKSSDEIFLAFLKGFFEGDGYITKNNYLPSLGFSVTNKMATELQFELLKRFSIKSSITKDHSIFRLTIGGTAPVFFILLNMYKVKNDIFMKRKFKKAQQIWKIFLPNYLKNIMPKFSFTYILNEAKNKQVNKILASKFSYDTQQINLKNIETNEVFIGTREEFYLLYGIKKAYINRLIRGERKMINNWICQDIGGD